MVKEGDEKMEEWIKNLKEKESRHEEREKEWELMDSGKCEE